MLGSKRGFLPLPMGRILLRVHFLLPVAFVAIWFLHRDWFPFYAILLGSLFLHETSHALASLALGGDRSVVYLHPLFGWAAVRKFPDRKEALTAVAGPAANLLLAGVLAVAGASVVFNLAESGTEDFLLTVTLAMGLGNLIPIPFPTTDGWRILKALRAPAPDPEGQE